MHICISIGSSHSVWAKKTTHRLINWPFIVSNRHIVTIHTSVVDHHYQDQHCYSHRHYGRTVAHQINAFMNHQFKYHWKLTLNERDERRGRNEITDDFIYIKLKIQYPHNVWPNPNKTKKKRLDFKLCPFDARKMRSEKWHHLIGARN